MIFVWSSEAKEKWSGLEKTNKKKRMEGGIEEGIFFGGWL
jgi:hypothetical protein